MKTALFVLGWTGLTCDSITASFRFADGRFMDGFAWALLGLFTIASFWTTARNW